MNLTILRGISGSGKSTWAQTNAPDAVVASADDFFRRDGEYVFNPAKLHDAHKACFATFLGAALEKAPLIVVDNTNIALWEISPYALAGGAMGYDVRIITLRCSPEVAIARKQLVEPEKVRRLAKILDEETRRMPSFMRTVHEVIQTDTNIV